MKKTALITGASTGIGHALTECFAQDGYDLVLTARSGQKLEERAEDLRRRYGVSSRVIVKDLSLAESPAEIYRQVREAGIFVEVLVNNAGIGTYGLFAETELQSELETIKLNMVSLTHLTKLFLKEMVEKKRGRIMNVASTAAFQPGPLMAVYYATKAYVLSFSQALDEELVGSGVRVCCFCPGPTESEFSKRAGISEMRLLKGWVPVMKTETAARTGYQGLMRGKRIVIPGGLNRLGASLVRWAPRTWVTRVVKWFQRKKEK